MRPIFMLCLGESASDETYIGLKVGEEEQRVNEKVTT